MNAPRQQRRDEMASPSDTPQQAEMRQISHARRAIIIRWSAAGLPFRLDATCCRARSVLSRSARPSPLKRYRLWPQLYRHMMHGDDRRLTITALAEHRRAAASRAAEDLAMMPIGWNHFNQRARRASAGSRLINYWDLIRPAPAALLRRPISRRSAAITQLMLMIVAMSVVIILSSPPRERM